MAARKRRFSARASSISAWVESGVLALIVPLIGAWVSRRDPLFVRAAFPWSAIAPLIAGVRYGFAAGFGCAVLIVFTMLGAWQNVLPLPFPAEEFPMQIGVGLLIVGMVAGEFSDLWKRRLQSLETEQDQLRRRYDGFARTYQALRLSHDLLESRVAGLTTTVREGLRALSEESFPRGDGATMAQGILDLFATHCDVRAGAVYLCDANGELAESPTARLGDLATPSDHPLVAEALRRKAVASAAWFGPGDAGAAPGAERAKARTGDGANDDLLVAAPFLDLDDRVRGLLVVSDMPFMAFGPETLRRIAVLSGRLGDLLGADRDARGDDRAAMASFIRALYRSLRERRAHGLLAGVVRFVVAARTDAAVTRLLCGERRTTDRALATGGAAGGTNVTVLLPLTDEIGIARYLARVEAQVRARTGASLDDSGVEVVYRASIDDQSGDQLLRDLQLPAAPANLDPEDLDPKKLDAKSPENDASPRNIARS
jgi:hypothetical protein